MTIHNKTDVENWSDKVEDWEEEFDEGDFVISEGHDVLDSLFTVSEIDPHDEVDAVTRKAAFWSEEQAEYYAELLEEKQ